MRDTFGQMATVTYDHVSKKFGDVTAVNDLNLAVRDSEFLVLVGPSGCGKTTALRMLAGLEEQTNGDIRIGERVVNDVPPKDRDIAMVFQNYALYPHMSVYDNIAFGLKLRGMPKQEIERRVNEVSQMLGIGQLLKRKPKELFSELGEGEPVRVIEVEDEHAEARFVAAGIAALVEEGFSGDEIGVFYRTNAQSRVLEDVLVRQGVAYQVIGKSSRAPGQPVRRGIHRLALHELLPGEGLRIAGQRRRGRRVLQSAAHREGRGSRG